MTIVGSLLFRQNQATRVLSAIQRSFADAHHDAHVKKLDPVVPKLNVPPEYAKLYDIKQEPGFVVINGRRYPYPYPGIHAEYNYLEMLEKWRAEGKVDRDNRPIFTKMKGMEKLIAKQLWYQRDPTLPVWKLGKYDDVVNVALATYFACASIYCLYWFYRLVVRPENDIYDYKNWIRWGKEHH